MTSTARLSQSARDVRGLRTTESSRVLGNYELIERLGEGGMGEVWRARHRLLARDVAVKLVRPGIMGSCREETAITLSRFEREAKVTASLSSPHTIRIFDYGRTDEGTFYYVMELLDGRDLESLIQEFGPLPPSRVMYLLQQICSSLAEAHERGLIHRDIKPANIYLCRKGFEYDFVKVLDFGLVKQEEHGPASTRTTVERFAIGTPAYMAPESILGDPDADRRVDMYAVGCVAYYLLTGELVFSAKSPMSMLLQHVQEPPVPPSERSPQHIPADLEAIVMACLDKDPNRRPTAEELLQMTGNPRTTSVWNSNAARRWWQSRLAAAVVTAVLLVASPVLAQPAARTQAPKAPVITAADLSRSLEGTAQTVSPSVVEIFTTSIMPREGIVARTGDLIATERASGSGVIVDPDGFIITNAHVVRGAQRVRVEIPATPDGESILAPRNRALSAQVVGLDVETDLALIKIDQRNLPALPFGDSDELRAGQLVMAIGSPLGFRNTVSFGVVGSVARQLEPESPMIYVQTDATINQGSSGGPLVDLRGRIVGINTLIFSQTGGYEGLGFAAPSNIVRTVYEQLRKSGRVRRGDIGARAQTITPVLASGLKLSRDRGVVLADVLPGSPAARAGLKAGDLVLTFDGKAMENGRQFQVTMYRRFVGDVVTLEILRGKETLKVPVAISERADFSGLADSIDPRLNLISRLGVLGVTLDSRLSDLLPALRVSSGVVVASMVPGAIDAPDGGLAPGDVIYSMNGEPVKGLNELRARVEALREGDAVVLHVERRGELMYVTFRID